LLQGLHKAIPRFPPREAEYLSDLNTLHKIMVSLDTLPGRKNVLWFSGGSARFLVPNGVPVQDDAAWRNLYDDLDRERIAIYPVDARGLLGRDTVLMDIGLQHVDMDSVAVATGGHAFYNDNGFKKITEHILDSDRSFYTLTYSPRHLHFNNKWHKLHVDVDGASYHLSYRTGYFADEDARGKDQPIKARTRLLASGETLEESEPRDRPVIFRASVLPRSDPAIAHLDLSAWSPAPGKKGSVPFFIRYTVPLNALTMTTVDGKHQVVLGILAMGLNSEGVRVEQRAQQLTLTLPENVLLRPPDLPITVGLQINLSRDDMFLNLGVWDPNGDRFGHIQMPVEVPKLDEDELAAGQN